MELKNLNPFMLNLIDTILHKSNICLHFFHHIYMHVTPKCNKNITCIGHYSMLSVFKFNSVAFKILFFTVLVQQPENSTMLVKSVGNRF